VSHSLPQTAAMTLSEFLLARIAEDEAAARAQLELRAKRYPGEIAEPGPAYEVDRGWWLLADPARVLAECEAKRRIVERVTDVAWTGSYAVRDVVLGLLALPYAAHPDYRDEWRP
jgi:hypothetical protein